MNQERIDALGEQILAELIGAAGLFSLYLGYRLGLFLAMAESGAVTAGQLAQKTQLSERYVREWLLAVATSEYVETDANGILFTLPPEHAVVLTDEESPYFMGAFPGFLHGYALAIDPLIDAFRTGGGVPFTQYGSHFREAIALSNRPMYQHEYAQKWIPAMPDVEAKLQKGARVADVGSGVGWSSILLAKHFANVEVDGIDADEASVREARFHAEEHGVSDRVRFHLSTIENFAVTAPYDLVTSFECLHDLPYPVEALRRMHQMTGPDGTVFIADEAAGETFADNRNPMGRLLYNVSVLHCLPQALAFPDAAGTGTAISESTVRAYADEAGFRAVSVLDIPNPFFRFYRLTP